MTSSFNFSKILTSSLAINPQDNSVVRNLMADGYGSQFPRFSTDFIVYDVEYLMTKAQYLAFITWIKTNRAVFFDFVDPVDDLIYQGRIVEGKFGAAPFSINQTYFSVTMQVERVM